MTRVKSGLIAGLVFGIIDIIPMIFMNLPNRYIAIAGAFVNRFAIGFLIPNTSLQLPGWLTGIIIGFLLSLPDAIITGVYAPIMGFGVAGGLIIGLIVNKRKQ